MGFYGSVYYQLIDTFHKIIVGNNGKSHNTKDDFSSNYENSIFTQAEGRKGIINLDTGNAWIGFTKGGNVDDPIKIWHSEPQISNSPNQAKGFMKINSLPEGASATKLSEEDLIESCSILYDNAGHAVFTPHYYYLPKADISNRVNNIIETIGESDGLTLPNTENKTLFGYIAKNKAEIDISNGKITNLQGDVGEWDPDSKYNNRTISDIIGDYRKILGVTGSISTSSFKDLSTIIGDFKSINSGNQFDTDPEKKPSSIIDAIIKLKTLIVNLTTEMKTQDDSLATKMGTYEMPEGSNLYGLLQGAKTTLNDKIDNLETDVNNELDDHESRISAAEKSIGLLTNGAGTEEIDSVNELIEYVKAHGPQVTGILDSIDDLKDKVGDQTVSDQIDAKLVPIKTLVGTDSVSKQIDDKLASVKQLIGTDSVSKQIDDKLAPVKQLVGTETVSKQIDDKLEALVGTETVSKQIDDKLVSYSTTADINSKFALQSDLNALSTLVGTESVSNQIDAKLASYSTTADINSKISTALSDYALQSDLNTLSGLVGEESVPTQIESAFTEANLSQYVTNATLENYYDKTGVETKLSTYASKGDLDQYITEDDLSNTEGKIMAILGSREESDIETVFEKFDNYILKSEIDNYIANSIGAWQSSVDSQIKDLSKQLEKLTGQTDNGSEGGTEGAESGGNAGGTESGDNTGTEPGTNPEGTEPGGDTEGTEPGGDTE